MTKGMVDDRILRIAFLTPEYVSEPKFDGGLANYIYRVSKALREAGHVAEVFVTADRDETIHHEGVAVHRCAPSRALVRVHRLQRRIFRRPWFGHMDFLLAAQALARRFREIHDVARFDLVEASNFKGTALLLRGRGRPPMVTRISFRSHLWDSATGRRPDLDARLRYWIEDRSMLRSDAIYGPCRRIAQIASRELGRSVRVIHPPLFRSVVDSEEDESLWRSSLDRVRYVLFFGRICRVKGADVLAEAMRPILEKTAGLRLVMVGRSENDAILDEVHEALGEQVCKFLHLPRQPHATLFPIVRNAELVALPSRVDNFPNVCIEAMLQGQLVIGTKDTGFEDLISDGDNGLLVDPGDPVDLGLAIERALAMQPSEKERMRNRASQTVVAMEPRVAAVELLGFYKEVIRSNRRH